MDEKEARELVRRVYKESYVHPDDIADVTHGLVDRITELEKEVEEQCLLNAKGQERELSLMGRLSRFERIDERMIRVLKLVWAEGETAGELKKEVANVLSAYRSMMEGK